MFFLSFTILLLYPNFMFSCDMCSIFPPFNTAIDSTASLISTPNAPAFVTIAPPTVPGIPDKASSPLNPFLLATSATFFSKAPLSAIIPPYMGLIALNLSVVTAHSISKSLASTLLPLPSNTLFAPFLKGDSTVSISLSVLG